MARSPSKGSVAARTKRQSQVGCSPRQRTVHWWNVQTAASHLHVETADERSVEEGPKADVASAELTSNCLFSARHD